MNSPKRILLAVALAYAASLPAHADCVLPPAPSKIPDASTASQQEMITAMQTLKEYNGDVDTYTKCLEFEQRRNRISFDDQTKHRDIALNTLATVAAQFNEQVRRFKARHS